MNTKPLVKRTRKQAKEVEVIGPASRVSKGNIILANPKAKRAPNPAAKLSGADRLKAWWAKPEFLHE